MKLKRSTVVMLTLFLVFSVTVTWMVLATLQRSVAGPTNTYAAIFSDVSGLIEGDDVRVAGVRVGRVDKIDLVDTDKAKVTFRIKRNQTLYTNTIASVTYQNIIGQRYVGLTQGEGERVKLQPGSVIPEERTNPSFDIAYMLNGFEPLFTELDPKQVDNLTNAIVQAFQGDEGSILNLTTQASTLTATLAGPDKVLGDLIGSLDRLMITMAKQNSNLKTVLHQAQSSLVALNGRRDELETSVGTINASVTRLSKVVDGVTPPLTQLLEREPGFLQHGLTDGRARLSYLVANLPLLLKGLARISQEGTYANLYACDIDLGLFRTMFYYSRMFVAQATRGNGQEVFHSTISR